MNELRKTERRLVEFLERNLEEGFADPAKLAAWRLMPVYLQRQDVAGVVAKLLRQNLGRISVVMDVETADFLTEAPESATGWLAAAVAEAKHRGSDAGRAAADRKIAFLSRLAAVRAAEADRIFDLVDDFSDDTLH